MAENQSKESRLSLKRLLRFGFGGETETAASSATDETRADWVDSAVNADLSIEDLLKGGDAAAQGNKVHIVSLKDFRAVVGERWESLAGKVMVLAESIVKRHLGPGNVCGRHGDDTFLLVFRKLDEAAGRARATALVTELGQRLVGEQFKGARICLAEADPASLMGAGGEIDLKKIASAVAGAKPASAPPVRTATRIVARGRGRPTQAPPANRQGPDWQKIDDTAPARTVTMVAGATAAPAEEPPWERLQREKATTAGTRMVLARNKHYPLMYAPAWRPTSEALDAFLALPARHEAAETILGDKVLPAGADAARFALLDADVIEGALRALAIAEGIAMVAPVHFASLSDVLFPTLAELFDESSLALGCDRLTAEIVAIPPDATAAEIARAIGRARLFAGEVLVRALLGAPAFAAILPARPAAVGFEVLDGTVGLTAIGAAIARFAEGAAATPVYMWGARRREEVAFAVERGFAYVGGPALKAPADKPATPVALPREKFLALLAQGRRG